MDMTEPEARFDHILTELNRSGRVSVQELADHFQVSRETIRRDLKHLELAGHLRCVYGGGVKPQPGGDEPIAQRMRVNAREKARIAVEAAKLLRDDIKIFLDAGTTTLALARHLKDWPRITVYTNSLDIVELLCGYGLPNVVAVGGHLSPSYRAFMGTDPQHLVSQHLFDIAFVGIVAVDYELGFMDLGQDEAILRRLLRRHSKQCVMLADGSKFGRQGSICTYELRDVDILVTDAPIRADFARKLDQAQVEVRYAQP
jgi:DeoR family glycerol-3-phosphate regulon repressor